MRFSVFQIALLSFAVATVAQEQPDKQLKVRGIGDDIKSLASKLGAKATESATSARGGSIFDAESVPSATATPTTSGEKHELETPASGSVQTGGAESAQVKIPPGSAVAFVIAIAVLGGIDGYAIF